MQVVEMREEDRPAWDAFVSSHRRGLPQQLSAFQTVLCKTYDYETHYLMALENSQIVGILPTFIVPSFLLGKSASTMPGGMCADDHQVAAALIAEGKELASRAGAKQFVLRDAREIWDDQVSAFNQHVTFVVKLEPDEDILWEGLHKNLRRQVRMARNNDLTVEIDHDGSLLGEFYGVLTRFTHQAGTPVFGINFLENLIKCFPDCFDIVVVRKGGQSIGGYFQLTMGDTVYGLWGGALRQYLTLRPVYLAVWEIMRDAAARGFCYLDMGRSPVDSGPAGFKKQWGGEVRPIYQQILSLGEHNGYADVTVRTQSDPRFHIFKWIWQRLPLPMVQHLGPGIRHHIPFA